MNLHLVPSIPVIPGADGLKAFRPLSPELAAVTIRLADLA